MMTQPFFLTYIVNMSDKVGRQVNTELLHEIVEVSIGDEVINNSFIRGFKIISETDTAITIALISPLALDYVTKEYKDVFERGAETLYGKNLDVKFTLEGQATIFGDTPALNSKRVDRRFTFDNYVAANFNEEAIKIALKVIETPGSYSPFFITAKSGLGKTHLLHALGNEFVKNQKSVVYIDPNSFTKEITAKSQEGNNSLSDYIDELKRYDVLLFDDVQNLGDRTVTLRVLFDLVNFFIENNKQIVIVSDKLVQELSGFEERFITRFSSGLTTTITDPSIDDLVLVLEKKLTWRGLDLGRWEKDALRYVARNHASSIRALEGAVKRIGLFLGADGNAQYTVRVISNIFKELAVDPSDITPQRVIQAVSNYYKISAKNMVGKSRKKEFVLPRHIAIYLIRHFGTKIPLVEIGKIFSNRDHTSILAALRKVDTLILIDRAVKLAVDKLERNIKTMN